MVRHETSWPELLTARRAISYSGCSRTSIKRAVDAGLLPIAGRVGGKERGERVFRRSDIDAWLLGKSKPASPVAAPVAKSGGRHGN